MDSRYDPEGRVPFHGRRVHSGNAPVMNFSTEQACLPCVAAALRLRTNRLTPIAGAELVLHIQHSVHSPIRVMIVDENEERAALLETGIRAGGYEVVARLIGRADLQEKIDEIQPDVIIIDMECPDRDTLEAMSYITRHQPRPTVIAVDRSDSESIRAAVQAGVSGYVVGGLSPERVRPVLEVAIARFNEFQALRRELEQAKSSLAERKVIERAKGILMKRRSLPEDEAFRVLRKMAMDRKARLAEVAREIVAAAELLA
jgi:two-component system, response regulator / RNA-binding antiterminator